MELFTKKHRGFTLIELLVVIAIIGILASIVLVSLGGARDKANDAAIKADLNQSRSVAELLYDDESYNYTNFCESAVPNGLNNAHLTYGTQLGTIETGVSDNNGGTAPTCYADADSYCVFAPLKTSGFYCVDSTGRTGEYAAAPATCAAAPAAMTCQ